MSTTNILIIIFGVSTLFAIVYKSIWDRIRYFFKKTKYHQLSSTSKIFVIRQINDAIEEFSSKKIGAIITIEMRRSLDELRTDGLAIDSKISGDLLIAIFQKNSPIHDGAVVIAGDRIKYVGTFYHITEKSVSNSYGSRHRAAIGISEQSDAVSIVVSEETGRISFVQNGRINILNSEHNFQDVLAQYLK